MNPAELGNEILRNAGLFTEEALRAKRNIDARLAGLGLPPSIGLPTKVPPGFTVERPLLSERLERILRSNADLPASAENIATSAILLDPNHQGAQPPQVVPAQGLPPDMGQATFEPSDLAAATAVTSLATTANGGTEIKFSKVGVVYVGAGPIGVYWNRAVGASINTKWAPVMSGMRLAYHPASALFFGTNTVGSISVGGVLTLAFFEMPASHIGRKGAWRALHKQIGEWTEGSGGDGTAVAGGLGFILGGGAFGGTDVTLGTFSDAGVGTQIYRVGTNMPVGGASLKGVAILNAAASNNDMVFVAETSPLAVATNGPLSATGQDSWNIPVGGKLFMLANSGTQIIGARFRS